MNHFHPVNRAHRFEMGTYWLAFVIGWIAWLFSVYHGQRGLVLFDSICLIFITYSIFKLSKP